MKGATVPTWITTSLSLHFNPRTREGCDNAANGQAQGTEVISIHAPVKGATLQAHLFTGHAPDFNPRTREGCDPNSGGRTVIPISHFNPRTREGCDNFFQQETIDWLMISIHAPVKGAT